MSNHQQVFDHIKRSWERMGCEAPWYSVLTGFSKTKDLTPHDESVFYQSGEKDVAEVLSKLKSDVVKGTALDFGCGVGRLTFALANRFAKVLGCDQSEPHLEIAVDRAKTRAVGKDVLFYNNDRHVPLAFMGGYDFIISLITLQHMPPSLMEHYISEFCEVLAEGGVCFIQVPVYLPNYNCDKSSDVEKAMKGGMQMHCIELSKIMEILRRHRCKVVSLECCDRIGIEFALSLGIEFTKPPCNGDMIYT